MPVQLEMISDLACPWCWLGLRRISAAIDEVKDEIEINLVFRPYELDPTIKEDGECYQAYMKGRFSSDEAKARSNVMRDMLEDYGRKENIPFHFDRIEKRPNTLNAHRVIRWAQGQNLGFEAKENLFKAYFSDGKDIGDKAVLVDIASKTGLDGGIIADLLKGSADIETVQAEENFFRQLGIAGVPTFLADRKIAVQGVEEVHKLVRFLKEADRQQKQAA